MFPGKALLVSVPVALAGAWLLFSASGRVSALRRDVAALEAEARREGESFVATLQGAHAERQRELLDRRHDAALRLATARRDRLLGGLLVAAAALAFTAVRVAQRVAAEVEEDRRLLQGGPPAAGRRPS
jgi:predicted phage gp36 major capsid-like protein